MIQLLSYIYPVTKKVRSEISGDLEITWYNGKKHLNTKNANYSYGSLQKILKIGLQKIDLSQCENILILGMGGGSVIKTLQEDFNYKNTITAVDIDPVIIGIAKQEFNVSKTNELQIICADALQFMQQNNKQFDLVIIDLFIDTEIPNSFFGTSFWQDIMRAIAVNGTILFNASLHKTDNDKLSDIILLLKKNNYTIEKIEKVDQTNTLLIAKLFHCIES